MPSQGTKQTVTVDATGKTLGRLASEIAVLLRGKQHASFEPRAPGGEVVRVEHTRAIKLTGKKGKTKMVKRYSGYPSGLKMKTWQETFERNPAAAIRKTVRGMLPANKWRDRLLKNLIIAS